MARSGRFGRLPREAADLSSTIASMVEQYENARDRNIEFAWRNGEKFEGKGVTDGRFLKWWEDRRAEVSDDDPMADFYDQQIFNYKFQIGEQKIALALEEDRINERQAAAWYVSQAQKVPRQSAAWRELMLHAAQLRNSAAKGRASGNAQAKYDRYVARRDGIYERYEKPAADVEAIVNDVVQRATGQNAADIWSVNVDPSYGGEVQDVNLLLSNIEEKPYWPRIRERLERADPNFNGHLTVEYLRRTQDRAGHGAGMRADLADKNGYKTDKESALKSRQTYADKSDLYNLWDETVTKAGKWYRNAVRIGLNDADPKLRANARAWLAGKLSGEVRRLERKGDIATAGRVEESLFQVTGDPRGAQGAGIFGGYFGSLAEGTEGSGAITDVGKGLMEGAASDGALWDSIGKQDSVMVVQPDGQRVFETRESLENDPSLVMLPTEMTSATYKDQTGTTRTMGVDAQYQIGTRMTPISARVARARDEVAGGIVTDEYSPGPGDSTLIGYEGVGPDGRKIWKVFTDKGVRWTFDDPFSEETVVDRKVDQGGGIVVYIDPTTPGAVSEITGTTDRNPVQIGVGRAGLRPDLRGEAPADEGAQPTPTSGRQPLYETTGFSPEQRAKFGSLSGVNQRFLIDRGLTGIPIDQMTDASLDEARKGGYAASVWKPGGGARPVPEDQAAVLNQLSDLDKRLRNMGYDRNDSRFRALAQQRATLLRDSNLPNEIKDQLRRKFDAGVRAGNAATPEAQQARKEMADIDTSVAQQIGRERVDEYTDPTERFKELQNEYLTDEQTIEGMGDNAYTQSIRERMAKNAEERRQLLNSSVIGRAAVQRGAEVVTDVAQRLLGQRPTGQQPTQQQPTTLRQRLGLAATESGMPTQAVATSEGSFYALWYGQDRARREELARKPYWETLRLIRDMDPDYRPGGPGDFTQLYKDTRLIYIHGRHENSEYEQAKQENDGVPRRIATIWSRDPRVREQAREQQRQAKLRAGQLPDDERDPEDVANDEPTEEQEDKVEQDGAYVWGGGRWARPGSKGDLSRAPITEPVGGATSTDRPSLKLPSMAAFSGFGLAQTELGVAERARLRLEKERGASVGYDPQARAAIPGSRSSFVRPEIKVAKPPKPAEEVKTTKPEEAEAIKKANRETVIKSAIGAAAGGLQTKPKTYGGLSKYSVTNRGYGTQTNGKSPWGGGTSQ